MQMATVMMSIMMKPASLMEEIAVDLMSIQSGAQNAYALNEVEVVMEEQEQPCGTTSSGGCNQYTGDGYCDDINNNLAI